MLTNVFNVLGNKGFLRDQGVMSLEPVQLFHERIKQQPVPASMNVSNLIDFCCHSGYHEPLYQPVIELTGHAVVVHSYNRGDDYLVLLTIDSASPNGYTFVFSKIHEERLLFDQYLDLLCLASDKCYHICFK